MRVAPDSYADLVYHSKIAQPFRGRDGALRLCRFRLLRGDLTCESGLPSAARQREIWNQARDPDDDRPTDYLRREFIARLRSTPIEYQLQLRLRDWEILIVRSPLPKDVPAWACSRAIHLRWCGR